MKFKEMTQEDNISESKKKKIFKYWKRKVISQYFPSAGEWME